MKAQKMILIIDDYTAVRRAVRRALGDFGYEVLTAKDGEEGLTMTQPHRSCCAESRLTVMKIPVTSWKPTRVRMIVSFSFEPR